MDWHAMPPEVNTSRLMLGAGPLPMVQAAAGWEAFAILLETQADELMASLSALTAAWSGSASEQAVQATMPMVMWLRTTSLQAHKRALQATAQADSYSLAMVSTPPLPEIAENRITTQVLYDTNFFFVNTVPIGVHEVDYWVRMWNQAAVVMDTYAAETAMNTVFEPILPMMPIVIPGVGEGTAAGALGMAAAMAPGAAVREAAFAHVTAQSTVESVGLTTGRMVGDGNMIAERGEGAAQQGENAGQQASQQGQQQPQQAASQGLQMATQMGSQLGSSLMSLPQQMGQMVSQPMQQLMSPLQQVTSLFSGSNNQVGLMGASPFSNHPLVGGSGMSSGAGLVRAASLPGAGGMSARTPIMSNLVGKVEPPSTPIEEEMVGAAGGGKGGGLAPVNSGAGSGSPAGMAGERGKSGGTRAALLAPNPLPQNIGEEDDDDW
jgi:PPE-repeat protein